MSSSQIYKTASKQNSTKNLQIFLLNKRLYAQGKYMQSGNEYESNL